MVWIIGILTQVFCHPKKYRIGKENTWKIERKNLNFRTDTERLQRKTICFSKNVQMHDNPTGMYIEKYYYKTSMFGWFEVLLQLESC